MSKGKVIVTGSASGIGAAVTVRLIQEGFHVVGLDLDTGADVTNMEQMQGIADEHSDAIGVVCCAGIGPAAPMHKPNALKTFHKVIDVNLMGTANLVIPMFAHMRANPEPCSIVNVSSIWGLDTQFGLAGYCSSKRAVRALSHTIVDEGARKGVLACTVNPTYTATPLLDALDDDTKKALIASQCPTGAFLTPDYVAVQVVRLFKNQLAGHLMSEWTDKRLDGTEHVSDYCVEIHR